MDNHENYNEAELALVKKGFEPVKETVLNGRGDWNKHFYLCRGCNMWLQVKLMIKKTHFPPMRATVNYQTLIARLWAKPRKSK